MGSLPALAMDIWAFSGRFILIMNCFFDRSEFVECISVNRAITAHLQYASSSWTNILFLLPVLLELTDLVRFGGSILVAGL